MNLLSKNIESLILNLPKDLEERANIDKNFLNSEKFNSIQNKYKSKMSEAKAISSDLVSESKNYSSLNTEEYESNIEAFDPSKKSEFINNTKKIKKDIDELENSLIELVQEGIIDRIAYEDLNNSFNNFAYLSKEHYELFRSFQSISDFPMRRKCATLSWLTLDSALNNKKNIILT